MYRQHTDHYKGIFKSGLCLSKLSLRLPALIFRLLRLTPGPTLPLSLKHTLGLSLRFMFALTLSLTLTLTLIFGPGLSTAHAATASRASAFEYDPVSGLLTKEIIEPDNSDLCLVTSYTYDSFGNKVSSTTRNCNGSAGSHPGTNSEAAAPAAGTTTTTGGNWTFCSNDFEWCRMTGTKTARYGAGSIWVSKSFTGDFACVSTSFGSDPLPGQAKACYLSDGTSTTTTTGASDALIASRTSTTTYDARGQFPVSSTNALNQTESKTYNADFGTVATLTGPNGLTTSWTYDSFGRPLTESRADGTSSATAYALCDASCAANGKYTITASQPGAPTSKTTYDMLGRTILSQVPDKNGILIYTSTEYDKLGRTSRSSRPYKSSASAWASVTYDTIGRPLTTTAPDNTITSVVYNGYTTTTTNAKSQTRTEVKNSQGQLTSVTDTQGKTLSYQYDTFGNLSKTTDALNNITSITYDKRGRKTAMSDPDQGNWTYSYDALGQLKKQTDAKNQVVTFSYDKLGRMTQRNEPDLVSTWTYDTCDATLNPSGKCIGKPVKETSDNNYARTYLYDSYGRPTAELDNVDSGYGVSKSYDSYGRVANLVYPNGFGTTNVYSASGYLTEVRNTASNALYWQAGTTDNEGRLNQFTYGNGVTTNQGYDAMGRITTISAGLSSNSTGVSNQSFVYDSIGNLTQRYDGVTGLNEAFGYDSLNRLTSTSAQAGSGPLTQVTLTYNEIGNIKTKSDVGTYTYASAQANGTIRPHAVSKIIMNDGTTVYANYTYDANGNMLTGLDSSNKGRTVVWNSWNMPNSIVGNKVATSNATLPSSTPINTTSSSFAFVYNSAHERVKETLPDGTVIYNISPRVDTGIHVEKRIKTDGTILYVNSLYAGNMPFGTVTVTKPPNNGTQTTQTRYFHTDHLGSIIAITNESGTITEQRSYDAWGKKRNLNGTAFSNAFVTPLERHGFTGHEELDEVGLIHMNGRLYDPAIGRFLSADPSIQYPEDMQNYNRYSYINNNPLSAVDYSGFGFGSFFKHVFKGVGKAIKGVVKTIGGAVKGILNNPTLRTIASIAVAVYAPGLFGITDPIAAGAFGGFASGLVAGRGDLKAALQGAITGAAFGYVGHGGVFENGSLGQLIGHAAVGCGSSMMGGGSCLSGALAAGFTKAFEGPIGGIDAANTGISLQRALAAAVVGGTASVLGGGKFENGAITGAFSRLFNDEGANRLKDSNQRHADAVAQEVADLRAAGYTVEGENVLAKIPGMPNRFYDVVATDAAGNRIGIEVKTTIGDVFRINNQQMAFDVQAINGGAVTANGPIQAVSYVGVSFGGSVAAYFSRMNLAFEAQEKGVQFYGRRQ